METSDLISEKLKARNRYLYPTKKLLYDRPVQLVRAKGCRAWDQDGKEYLDAIGGIVTISAGHNHPRIKRKMLQMLENDEIQHTTSLFFSLYMEELAEKLASLAPGELEKCYFTNSGSEANELAILTAQVSTGQQMIIALRHGYHGGTGVPLSLCGQSTWRFPIPQSTPVSHAMAPYCYRCPFGAEHKTCAMECADDVRQVIETTTHGKVAAIIAEPILGVGGFIDPPPGYHRKIYDIVKEFGGLYISDEVQTGVGRTGKNFFAIQDSDVTPDLITMAKGLGNGVPIGAVISKPEHADVLKGKTHFNTFGGDPYQCMQAKEVLSIIEEEKLIENSDQIGSWLKEGLKDLQKTWSVIGDVRGRGLMLALELVKSPKTKEPAPEKTARFISLCKDHGLLAGKGGLYGNVVRIAPPMSISKEEARELLQKITISLEKLD